MTNFFKHAPVQDTYQKRFLDAVLHKQNLMASFPLGYSMVSLYALAGLVQEGMAVVVCPNSGQIHRNLEYFKNAGMKFPEVTYLDGTQMPHEERAIHREINHNRVRILYITPERFISLTFLEVLVHAQITFLAIEEAERLLPSMPGHLPYKKLYEHGLMQLRKLPPMALMAPSMAPEKLRELSERLNLGSFQLIQCPPQIEMVELKVKSLFSEHQKFSALTNFLSGSPGKGRLGHIDRPGAVLIQTAYPAQAEKLGASLRDHGFGSVWVMHHKKSLQDQAQVMDVVNNQPNGIVVNAGLEMRYWSPPANTVSKVVFWTPPASLDDVLMQVFRQPQGLKPGYPGLKDERTMKALMLHTREDFQSALHRLQSNWRQDAASLQSRLSSLRQYREWVLSDECRIKSLMRYLNGTDLIDISACGHCDRCTENQNTQWWLRRMLKQWIF